MTTLATTHEIAEMVTAARKGGRFVSEACARSLYGASKTKEQVKAAALGSPASRPKECRYAERR